MCELSTKARAFSVEALLRTQEKLTQGLKDNGIPKNTFQNPLSQPLLMENITADLVCKDLWSRFYQLGNEMIITKAGRRMFPAMKVCLNGLAPEVPYVVFLDIVPLDTKKYRYTYHSSQWTEAGEGDSALVPGVYIHPDSPASGQLWMARGVTFDKLKLTNNKSPKVRGQITLHSMQKYIPRVHILPIDDFSLPLLNKNLLSKALTFSFKESEFITVTAYQNQKITHLKIASNPFAKGFRDAIKNRQLDKSCRPRQPAQSTNPTFSHCKNDSAFQKFQPSVNESTSNCDEIQKFPSSLGVPQMSLVDPLFPDVYKQLFSLSNQEIPLRKCTINI